jgi:hypothetical protein
MGELLKTHHIFSTGKKEKKKKPKKLPPIVKQIQKHQLKEINYALEKNISYSQISMFSSCPHKWALQYRDGHYKYSPSIHTLFGTSLHEALQHYITVIYEESGAAADRIDMESYFEERIRENYQSDYKKNNKTHFTDSSELKEFFEDGMAILNFIKKKRGGYFGKRGWFLVGCEIPILLTPNPQYKNVLYKGYLDVVFYHEPTNTFRILDIKTSTRGWGDTEKKDEVKQLQLVLYKKFYSQQFGVPEENIEIQFFIAKRKIWEDSPYRISRIQEYIPPSGKIKMNKATNTINSFIEEVFNYDGSFKDTKFTPQPSLSNCKFCPFSGRKDLCPNGIS